MYSARNVAPMGVTTVVSDDDELLLHPAPSFSDLAKSDTPRPVKAAVSMLTDAVSSESTRLVSRTKLSLVPSLNSDR